MGKKIDWKKANWMKRYESKLVELNPSLAGRVDWDTATFFYNEGANPEEKAILSASGLGR